MHLILEWGLSCPRECLTTKSILAFTSFGRSFVSHLIFHRWPPFSKMAVISGWADLDDCGIEYYISDVGKVKLIALNSIWGFFIQFPTKKGKKYSKTHSKTSSFFAIGDSCVNRDDHMGFS